MGGVEGGGEWGSRYLTGLGGVYRGLPGEGWVLIG